jgi:dienelactone hydrolase
VVVLVPGVGRPTEGTDRRVRRWTATLGTWGNSMRIRKAAFAAGGVAALMALGASCTMPSRPSGPSATTMPGMPGMDHGDGAAADPGDGGTGNQKGPDPTAASVTAPRGSFPIATASASGGTGFGGGTIYYPTAAGTYGTIVSVPGFLNPGSVMAPYGQKLASNGFVVLVANTNTVGDLPAQRATELMAAMNWLTTRSSVANKTDKNREGVFGYSMGGGGSLIATKQNPSLKAAVGMAPWNTGGNFAGDRVPVMIAACTGDVLATPATMGRVWYNQLSGPKAYFEMSAGNHACPLISTGPIGNRTLVWFKRYIDGDTRYQKFLCPEPITAAGSTGWKTNAC